jgi:PAS domain S-box-containing protein
LKQLVEQKLKKEVGTKILAQCKPLNLPPVIDSMTAKSTTALDKADYNLIRTIQAAQRSFVITDPALPDNPIIFASQAFLDLCGYKMEEVLGRNCRFLQGPGTDQSQVAILRKGIQEGADTAVCLLNYRADGSTFYNQIFLAALRDANQNIINYVGVQVEVSCSTFPRSTEIHNACFIR